MVMVLCLKANIHVLPIYGSGKTLFITGIWMNITVASQRSLDKIPCLIRFLL